MRTQNINRTDAEKMFGIYTNVNGGTISDGYNVHLCATAASIDGNAVVENTAENHEKLFIGFADEDIADTETGKVQTYGYKSNIRFYGEGTSISFTLGDVLGVGDGGASQGVNSSGVVDTYGPVVAMETKTCSAGGTVKGLIRAM